MPESDKDKHREEYFAIFSVFQKLIDSIRSGLSQWEVLEELMALRADFAIQHAIKGFEMDYEKALDLLKYPKIQLTEKEQAQRDILVAAIDNLVDFAVAEEYQMFEEFPELDEEFSEEDLEELEVLCQRYNDRYAFIENNDIEYAMIVAAQLLTVPRDTILMYMTQGDERVRPWHLQYEGFTAPKSSFPAWLIPPIEHQCRCYLIEDSVFSKIADVKADSSTYPTMPPWFNKTFKESVALGGRIFSDEHPYFSVNEDDIDKLNEIASHIKTKYLSDNG